MGESYNSICALADLFAVVKNTQQAFWRRCRGTVAVSLFEPSWSSYLIFSKKNSYHLFFLIFYPHPFYHGAAIYPKLLCS